MPEVKHGYWLRPRRPGLFYGKISKPRARKQVTAFFAILLVSLILLTVAKPVQAKEKAKEIETVAEYQENNAHDRTLPPPPQINDKDLIEHVRDRSPSPPPQTKEKGKEKDLTEYQENNAHDRPPSPRQPAEVALDDGYSWLIYDIFRPRPVNKYWPLAHRSNHKYHYRILHDLDVYGKPYASYRQEIKDEKDWNMRRIFVEHTPHPLLDGSTTTKEEDEKAKNQFKLMLRDFWAADFGIKPDTEGQVARFSVWYCQQVIVSEILGHLHHFESEERLKAFY